MKKYFTALFITMLFTVAVPVFAAPASTDAKAVLIEKLLVQLQVLITELNKILKQQDDVLKAEVSNSRVNAELFFITNKYSYKKSCEDIVTRMTNSSYAKKINFSIKPGSINCFDSATQYAVSTKVSNGYYCADSTGFSGTTTKAVTGTACR